MIEISWVPGAVVAGNNINLPANALDIDAVVSAEILRLPSGMADHPQADIVGALADHAAADVVGAVADHAPADIVGAVADHPQADVIGAIADHTLDTQAALGGAVTNALGHDAVPQLETAAGANVNIAGCISTHAAGAAAVAHAAGAAAVAHAAGAAAVGHGAGAAAVGHTGANPVVAATPTKVDGDTVTLDVNTLVGDVLYLTYMEEGARVLVS